MVDAPDQALVDRSKPEPSNVICKYHGRNDRIAAAMPESTTPLSFLVNVVVSSFIDVVPLLHPPAETNLSAPAPSSPVP
jgi:hypothetical protein